MKTHKPHRALFENERIVHLKGCKEISACACPVLNQYNLPLDADHNCVCLESLTPHAQHAPAVKALLEGRPRFHKEHADRARAAAVHAATFDMLAKLRAAGWMVAIHNDYRQHGRLMTFWLFVRNGIAVKGEGYTDAEALAQVLKQTPEGR